MKWLDDVKESAAAFKDWGRVLTIIGFIIAGLLVVIAIELLVACLKFKAAHIFIGIAQTQTAAHSGGGSRLCPQHFAAD